MATSGRCSGTCTGCRLWTARSAHEEDNAFGSKLEAMASYSSKYEDGRSGGGRRERHAASSSRRGAEWTEDDLARLKRAAAKYAGLEKNERWRKVGHKLGRSKRECYDRYKQLKEELSSSSASAPASQTRAGSTSVSSSTTAPASSSSATTKTITGGLGNLKFFGDSDSNDDDDNGFRIDYGGGTGSSGAAASSYSLGSARRSGRGALPRDTSVVDRAARRARSAPITIEDARQMRKLLFGDRRVDYFNSAWKEQGFFFDQTPGLGFGLVQKEGGPCGVLGAVQAFILKHLLFDSGAPLMRGGTPPKSARNLPS